MAWQTLLIAMGGGLMLWLVLLLALWWPARHAARRAVFGDALRLIPDVLRLFRRLAADRDLPRGLRLRMWLLLAYLALPIDLVPDFIPVIGYADDVILVAVSLRSVLRQAGPQAIEKDWPGTPDGLQALLRVTRLSGRSRR